MNQTEIGRVSLSLFSPVKLSASLVLLLPWNVYRVRGKRTTNTTTIPHLHRTGFSPRTPDQCRACVSAAYVEITAGVGCLGYLRVRDTRGIPQSTIPNVVKSPAGISLTCLYRGDLVLVSLGLDFRLTLVLCQRCFRELSHV